MLSPSCCATQPAHAHQYCRVAARNLTDAAKRAHNLLFRLFAHRTGIDHHHLRIFERRFKKKPRAFSARPSQWESCTFI